MTMMENLDLLTPAEACQILDVDYMTLWRWATHGYITFVRVGDHGWHKYPRRAVEALRDISARPWDKNPEGSRKGTIAKQIDRTPIPEIKATDGFLPSGAPTPDFS